MGPLLCFRVYIYCIMGLTFVLIFSKGSFSHSYEPVWCSQPMWELYTWTAYIDLSKVKNQGGQGEYHALLVLLILGEFAQF